ALAEAEHPAQRERLETARYSAEALLSILNDVLDHSRFESGKIDFEEVEFDVIKTVDSVLELMRSRLNPTVVMDAEFPSSLIRNLRGDGMRLRQILLNLVSNALKFTQHGTVRVVVEQQI